MRAAGRANQRPQAAWLERQAGHPRPYSNSLPVIIMAVIVAVVVPMVMMVYRYDYRSLSHHGLAD
jgi:hypothetical protein